MCNNVTLEGYFIEFLRSIKSNTLKGELFNIIVSYKLDGVEPLQVSEKAKPFLILITAIIDGANKENEKKEELSLKRKASVQKRWAKTEANEDFVNTKPIQNNDLYIQNGYKNDTNDIQKDDFVYTKPIQNGYKKDDLYIQNEYKTDTNDIQKEKEKKKEKESTPYNPLKEKEINKEKEKFVVVDVNAGEEKNFCDQTQSNEAKPQQQPQQQTNTEKRFEDFEAETFQKPLNNQTQKNRNDWTNDEERFQKNLELITKSKTWKDYSNKKFSIFTSQEKQEIFEEFLLRNQTDATYQNIYWDKDLQTQQKKHFLNFLNIKINLKKAENEHNSKLDDKTIGREYITQFKTNL